MATSAGLYLHKAADCITQWLEQALSKATLRRKRLLQHLLHGKSYCCSVTRRAQRSLPVASSTNICTPDRSCVGCRSLGSSGRHHLLSAAAPIVVTYSIRRIGLKQAKVHHDDLWQQQLHL